MKFVCPVCGYVYEGDAAPEKCPQCGVPGSKFTVIDDNGSKLVFADEHKIGVAEHGLSDLMDVVNSVPSLRTDYVPRDSIVREFVGGSCFEY